MAPDVAAEHLWKKSSYSDSQGGSCVEMADLTSQVGIRDSKNKQGPALRVPAPAWADFVGYVQSGEVDFGIVDN
ncbi:DUF397 domain-containing protein [Streptomyces sp. NPDC002730]|uniref:DUF397 domain-containing protein n=1 Tax=Streptomyces sp. NPDC002730 TaxID=3364662 RepID=UPI003694D03A